MYVCAYITFTHTYTHTAFALTFSLFRLLLCFFFSFLYFIEKSAQLTKRDA